jgi:hypothetical protein
MSIQTAPNGQTHIEPLPLIPHYLSKKHKISRNIQGE